MSLLADLILFVHSLFAAFVVAGLPLVWIGAIFGRRWARHRGFRLAHLAAILVVAAESLAGIWCPLTTWEDALRANVEEKSFVARWIHRLLFYDLPPEFFTAAYVLFAMLVALTWWLVPPQQKQTAQKNRGAKAPPFRLRE